MSMSTARYMANSRQSPRRNSVGAVVALAVVSIVPGPRGLRANRLALRTGSRARGLVSEHLLDRDRQRPDPRARRV